MSGRFEASDALLLLLLLVLVPPPLFATQDWFSIWLPATEMRRDKEEKKHRLLIYVDGTTGGGTEEAVKLMFMWLLPTLFLKVGEDGRERRRQGREMLAPIKMFSAKNVRYAGITAWNVRAKETKKCQEVYLV